MHTRCAYPPEARTGPIGLWAAVSGLAVAGGSVVGGLLLSVFPWSSIFWVNIPIAVVTLVISWFAVAESREPVPRPFDIGGVALTALRHLQSPASQQRQRTDVRTSR